MPLEFLFGRGRHYGSKSEDVPVGSESAVGGRGAMMGGGEGGVVRGTGCAVWGSRSTTVLQALLP